MRAWACGERTMAAWHALATGGWSSMKVPRPVRRRASSTRLMGLPIHCEAWAMSTLALHTTLRVSSRLCARLAAREPALADRRRALRRRVQRLEPHRRVRRLPAGAGRALRLEPRRHLDRALDGPDAGRPQRLRRGGHRRSLRPALHPGLHGGDGGGRLHARLDDRLARSEEHTSELQSRSDLVCRLLLEKKKKK